MARVICSVQKWLVDSFEASLRDSKTKSSVQSILRVVSTVVAAVHCIMIRLIEGGKKSSASILIAWILVTAEGGPCLLTRTRERNLNFIKSHANLYGSIISAITIVF